jgi:predicted PurR-regulated permease PerM
MKQILFIATFVLVLYWILSHTDSVGSIVSFVFGVLSPIIAGLCVAFVINVLLRQLEKLWKFVFKKKEGKWKRVLMRPVCLILTTLIFIGVIFSLIFIIVPQIKQTVIDFSNILPQYAQNIEVWWAGVVGFFGEMGIVIPAFNINLEDILSSVVGFLTQQGGAFIDTTINVTASILTGVVNGIIAFVLSIYVLAQKERLSFHASSFLKAVLPEKIYAELMNVLSLSNKTFNNFITGQLTEALIIGVLCFIGMTIFGMPYAAVISVLIGFTALIPIFGPFIGTAIGAFLILPTDFMKAIWFVVFIIVLQQIEGNLIYPRVMGKSVGLPGIWVLISVTVAANAFGLLGMLISVPVCSVLYALARNFVDKKTLERQKKAAASLDKK